MNDFGCLMVDFDIEDWDKLYLKFNPVDLYISGNYAKTGLPVVPHCTILYGFLPDVKHQEILSLLPDINVYDFEIKNVDLFENDDCDVLIVKLEDVVATTINERLRQFPHENKHPDYLPHITVAYLKKGTGKKYKTQFKDWFWQTTLSPINYRFSYSNGNEVTF